MGNKFDRIVEGIYLGNIDGARDKAAMIAQNISHIVSLRDNPEELHPGAFTYLLVDAEDHPGYDLSQHFRQCIGTCPLRSNYSYCSKPGADILSRTEILTPLNSEIEFDRQDFQNINSRHIN